MPEASTLSKAVERHYARPDLGAAILAALAGAGKDIDNLGPEDLAPIDEFHTRGREATLELARAAGLDAGKQVLDVGSGIGGPSRCIAREFGCRVTGIDLTDEYCRVATMLAQRVGLTDLVSYRQANALDLPFADGSFDVVWTQHVAMNIPDKARLYREMFRVLKPGGTVAIYDILAGSGGPVLFPVPWARSPECSFLVAPGELRRFLENSGFMIISWRDTTEAARVTSLRTAKRLQETGLPALGIHILLGQEFQAMTRNQRQNLEENRVAVVQAVARKNA